MAKPPEEVTINVKLVVESQSEVNPTGALARMICDLVEEATQRGMEIGAAMMLDSMQDDLPDEGTPKQFPGFLGDTDESETTNG